VAPFDDEMLWVYEGLTDYLGFVLAARSGLSSTEEWAGDWGLWFAQIEATGGRKWRPLQDTADFAQDLYMAPSQWMDARRGVDFYTEGALIWLAADLQIRGAGGKPAVKPYTFDELVQALNDVAPFDWQTFFKKKLNDTNTRALDAVTQSGWRIAWEEEPTPQYAATNGSTNNFRSASSSARRITSSPTSWPARRRGRRACHRACACSASTAGSFRRRRSPMR
jgi:predicted metalloprotease with PDZ domain